MTPTKYCPSLKKELEIVCNEGDGYYCVDYCPYETLPINLLPMKEFHELKKKRTESPEKEEAEHE